MSSSEPPSSLHEVVCCRISVCRFKCARARLCRCRGTVRLYSAGSRRYARSGDGVGPVVHGGVWWCLECLVVLGVLGGAQSAWVVALSHKNHDLHLDVRCCNLLLMENPRHSSHKSEPITPWPPQLPQLTRQAIPPSPISLQHPCPRSRQTMPIMGLSEFCRRRLSPSSERAGDIPLPAPPTRETRPAGN